jgi:hypothetical protein
MWSRDGRTLFFRGSGYMMAVDITLNPKFSAGKLRPLFKDVYVGLSSRPNYDVAADGRFLMVKAIPVPPQTQFQVVLNWFDELKRLAPVEK